MKIRVAILDQDQNYQNRVLVALRDRFYDKLEIFPCNNSEDILSVIEAHDIKVLAINQMVKYDISEIPENCSVMYLTETKVNGDVDDIPTVCKYQKVSDIGNSLYNWGKDYDKILAEKKEAERKAEEARLEAERKAEEERQRLEAERLEAERKAEEERLEAERKAEEERLEAERKAEEERLEAERKAAEEERIRLEEEKRAEEERIAARRSNPDIYVFVSGGNREGGTSAGIAFAKNGFVDDYNVLYLDLKQFSGMGRFFATINAETSYSKVLEKAGKDELSIDDIEKAISKDDTIGVDFINNKDCAFELVMLGDKGFENLVKKIGEMVKYDAIVISIENTISQMNLAVINAAKKVIFVGSGQQESNNHIERVVDVVRKYDEVNGTDNVHKINILYNRFVKRNCSVLRLEGVNVLGNLDNIKEKTEMRVVEIMSKMPVFRQIAE